MTTGKYISDHRKDRSELIDETKKTIKHNFCRERMSNQSNSGL